jgi:hypothetical protein
MLGLTGHKRFHKNPRLGQRVLQVSADGPAHEHGHSLLDELLHLVRSRIDSQRHGNTSFIARGIEIHEKRGSADIEQGRDAAVPNGDGNSPSHEGPPSSC